MAAEPHSVHQGVFRRTTIAVAALGFCVALLSQAVADETRTWSDSTGKYKIKAKFIQVTDGNVTLEREDGTQVTIALEKLSEADQKVVKEMQANDQNPFKAAKPARKSARKKTVEEEPEEEQNQEGAAGGEGKVVKTRWSDVKQVLPAPANDTWSLSIQAPKEPATPKRRTIAFPGKRDFFEHVKGLVVNPVCRCGVTGYVLDKDKGETRTIWCDLENGKMLGTGKTAGKLIPLALNDTGAEVLMRRDEFGFGNQDRLETWALASPGINKVLQWIPHDDQRGGDRDIKWARYVGEGKLVTSSGGGKLTLWDAATAKPLYWLKIHGNCYPALSPDRKYVAFTTDKEMGVLDLGAGEVAALQPFPKERYFSTVLAFTPKGTRLVCGADDRIYVWDVATGALFRDISLTGANVRIGENLVCPSEDHVLVGNNLLIDMETQAKLWTYQGHESVSMLGGLCWFEVIGKEAGALVSTVLPQPSVLEKIQKSLDSPDFFVLKPGVTVKLNVSGLADPGEREKAAASFTKKLQANGCQVGPNGTVELVATTEAGKRREVAYRTIGHGPPIARAYPFQEYYSRVKVVHQGQIAWDVSTGNVPGAVRLKQGETMEQFLKRHEHPNYEWFSTVELPKMVQKPTPGATTLGSSRVTLAGVQ